MQGTVEGDDGITDGRDRTDGLELTRAIALPAQRCRYPACGIQNQQAPVAGIADDNASVTENDGTPDSVQELGAVVTDLEQWRLCEPPFRKRGALFLQSLERPSGSPADATHGYPKGAEAQKKSGGDRGCHGRHGIVCPYEHVHDGALNPHLQHAVCPSSQSTLHPVLPQVMLHAWLFGPPAVQALLPAIPKRSTKASSDSPWFGSLMSHPIVWASP